MKKTQKSDRLRLGLIAGALIAAFVVAAVWYRRNETATTDRAAAENAERLVRPYSITLGPAAAPVTVVEFLDPECEACAAMYPITKRLMQEFDGRVRLAVRYMPLHHNSTYAAGLLEGARAQDKFWPLLEAFFARQSEWASHAAPRPEFLIRYVSELGLAPERVTRTASSPEVQQQIRQDQIDGTALGVRRTPTFFVNGRVLDRIGYEPLRAAIQSALTAQ